MNEQPAGERLQKPERTTRREAVGGLAADMLRLLAPAEGEAVTWQDGERTFTLRLVPPIGIEGGEAAAPEHWVHVVGPESEYAFSLHPGHEFAAPDEDFADIAEALVRKATGDMYARAKSRFPEPGGQFRTWPQGVLSEFRDFTGAEYGPFIWIRLGEPAEPTNYDLTEAELVRPDKFNQRGPVHPDEPHEAHVGWMLRAVFDQAAEEPALDTGGRATMYTFERPDPELLIAISGHEVEEAHDLMRILREGIEGLYVHTEGNVTVVRGVVDHINYDYSAHGSESVRTAIGLFYNGSLLHLEAFPVGSPVERTGIFLDLHERSGFGTRLAAETKEDMRGMAASTTLFDYTDSLGVAVADGLYECTPEITAHFQHKQIRESGADGQN